MRIALDGRGINCYRGTGIGTYTENVFKNLLDMDKKNFHQIYWTGENYSKFIKSNSNLIMVSAKHSKFFEEIYFPYNLNKEKIDLYHIPQNGIGLNQNIKCAKVVTIHDLIPYIMPTTVGKGYLTKFLREMPKIINLSDAILTVSEYSKKDILKFFPIDESKIYVIPLAADKKFKQMDRERCRAFIAKNYNINKPFILYIGGFSKRKNVRSLIMAFSKIYKNLPEDSIMVIIGKQNDEGESLVNLCSSLGISNNVAFTGFVPENHLPFFYNAAEIFVYPSLYEGFGLPPLEAMSCGTPVIASNVTSIPEIVQDSGILIDPHDTNTLGASMEKLMCNEKLKLDYSIKGLNTASNYTWKKTAKLTLNAYEETFRKWSEKNESISTKL